MPKIFVVTIILIFGIGLKTHAGLLHTYNQLTLKDLDQMSALIKNKVQESKKAHSGQIVPLKEALQSVFSRPNNDGLIEKIIPPLRTAIEQEGDIEKVFSDLIDEALNALTNTKNFKKEVQVTYSIFLENIISEFKSDLNSESFEFKMLRKIADKKVKLTAEAQSERRLKLMQEGRSPSDIARTVLEDFEIRRTAPSLDEASGVPVDAGSPASEVPLAPEPEKEN